MAVITLAKQTIWTIASRSIKLADIATSPHGDGRYDWYGPRSSELGSKRLKRNDGSSRGRVRKRKRWSEAIGRRFPTLRGLPKNVPRLRSGGTVWVRPGNWPRSL